MNIDEIATCIFCNEEFIHKDKNEIQICDNCFEKYKEVFEKLTTKE
jgi:hypothetical protein